MPWVSNWVVGACVRRTSKQWQFKFELPWSHLAPNQVCKQQSKVMKFHEVTISKSSIYIYTYIYIILYIVNMFLNVAQWTVHSSRGVEVWPLMAQRLALTLQQHQWYLPTLTHLGLVTGLVTSHGVGVEMWRDVDCGARHGSMTHFRGCFSWHW